MSKLLNRSLNKFMIYSAVVLVCSIPAYYLIISRLWQNELNEHKIILTAEAGREDSYLIIVAVTMLTVLFFVLLLGGLILLNRKIANRLWRPFYLSLAQIKNFDLNRQEKVVFEDTDIEEFSELNQSLDKLIAGNIAVFNQQKEFADNASHELQTPLAIIQSKLDLLLQSKSLTTDQYNIIEDALKALARVTRINKNLLLLTKIENSQYMDKERIDLSNLINSTLSMFANFSEDKQLELKIALQPGFIVEGNRILLEILLNNLITNAIRYSPPGETIEIALSESKLVIKNAGTAPLHKDQLFKRFATTSSQTPGTGLGLALVKQVANRYHWKIDYLFRDNLHIFSLLFSN